MGPTDPFLCLKPFRSTVLRNRLTELDFAHDSVEYRQMQDGQAGRILEINELLGPNKLMASLGFEHQTIEVTWFLPPVPLYRGAVKWPGIEPPLVYRCENRHRAQTHDDRNSKAKSRQNIISQAFIIGGSTEWCSTIQFHLNQLAISNILQANHSTF